MIDPSLAVLAATIDLLRTDPGVAAAFGSEPVAVWSTPPPGADDPGSNAYPFLLVKEIQVIGTERIVHNGETVDDPAEVFVTLHSFSRPRDTGADLSGQPEAIRLIKASARAFGDPDDVSLEVDDDGDAFRLVLCEIRDTRHFTDPDGVTAHSVATLRLEVDPTEG